MRLPGYWRIQGILLLCTAAAGVGAPFENQLQGCLPGVPLAGHSAALLADAPGLHVDWGLTSLYGIRELTEITAGVRHARGRWGGSLQFTSFGGGWYQENSLALGCGFRPTPLVAAGVRVRLLWQQGWEIRPRLAAALDLEVSLSLSDRLSFHSAFRSINEPRTGKTEASAVPLEMSHTLSLRCTRHLAVSLFLRSMDEGREALPGLRIAFGNRSCVLEGMLLPSPFCVSGALSLQLGRIRTISGVRANREGLGLSCFTAGSIRLSSTAASNRPPVTIDINRADSALLARLPGITPALAERIVRHRQLYGPFKRTRDICRIRGIGYRHFTAVAARLAVDGAGNDALPLREKGKSGMNLNNAEMRELVAAGITPDQARLLVLFRERIGGFATLQELVLIPGLSAATRGILRSLHE